MHNLSINDVTTASVSGHYTYGLANQRLHSTVELPQLRAFAIDGFAVRIATISAPAANAAEDLVLRYRGDAPFAGKLRVVEYLCDQTHGMLRIDGQLAYWLDFNTDTALCCLAEPSSNLALELLLGPVAVLLFNPRDLYCLHAGCVQTANGIVALIAESGVGKSTLAATAGTDWLQISDDVLVIDAKTLCISGAFPQLKLNNAQSDYFSRFPLREPLQINAIVRLVAASAKQISLEPLTSRDALLQVVRHSVGARLLSEQQLARHMLFCAELARVTPMWRAEYPRELNQLKEVRKAIAAVL